MLRSAQLAWPLEHMAVHQGHLPTLAYLQLINMVELHRQAILLFQPQVWQMVLQIYRFIITEILA